MSQQVTVDVYDIAENDRGQLLVAIFDLGADVEDATYKFDGTDLHIQYPDGRTAKLPNIPAGVRPVLHRAKEILIVESAEDSLVRAYDARNMDTPPTNKVRQRL